MTRPSALIQAVLLMATSAALTAAQNTLIRFLGDSGIHPFEIAFFRCVFGFVTVAPLVLWQERAWPRTRAAKLLTCSGLFHFTAMICFFTGVTLIPLNESAALTFAGPLFATIGAALFLREKVRARRWLAIAIGFLGVLIVLRPGAVPVSLGAALVLFSNMSFAGVSLLVKKMSATERTATVVFYQSLIVMTLTCPLAIWMWTTPTLWHLTLLFTLGALCTAGWLCFTRAFALADASAILPLEFTRLPFVALLAYLVFGEVPDEWVWIGAAVIFGSTLYIAHREAAAHRRDQIQRQSDAR